MSKFRPEIFRAYDIRGVYGVDLNEDLAKAIGLAYGTMLGNRGRVVVGRDVRLSGEALASAAAEGLAEAGCDVLDIGLVTTPMSYFAAIKLDADGGIQVTASHNPPEWNGFKLIRRGGGTLSAGAGMEELRDIVLKGRFRRGEGRGRIERIDILGPYVEFMASKIELERPLRIAIDYSNGAAAIPFPRIAERVGLEIEALNDIPDGRFPGHLPEPREDTLKDLQDLVVRKKVDFGAGFDGDGDRVVFVDDRGRILSGDVALAIFVKHLGKRGKVVFDVSSSSALREIVIESGCEPVEMRVGRAFILNAVRELNAVIGGEKSNHFYFPELWGFDDACYAVLRMAEIIVRSGRRLSELVDEIPHYPSIPITTFSCPDQFKVEVVERIARHYESLGVRVSRIDGVKAYFDDGWVLIRPSNTMPQIKMTAEAKTEERLREIVDEARRLITENVEEAKSGG
ncbi:MAG: phosphomannomutase/phosphoglucomutase [Candidatus Wolframiiraptor sp. EX4484-121]|nr:MAG: phosphomannomutase/phosphoglucomutase [Candidatus Wolframiiraptor sp. EX4484-121]